MQPIRVKLYGLVPLTRRTYLLTQAVMLCILLAVVGAAMLTVHTLVPGLLGWQGFWQGFVMSGAPLLVVVLLLVQAIEIYLVQRKFAREEAAARARCSGLHEEPAPRTSLADPQAIQPPPGVEAGKRSETYSES